MKNYKKIDHFEPIAMKCTQEQFNKVIKILKTYNMNICEITSFDNCEYLTNNLEGFNYRISNIMDFAKNDKGRKVYETFNAKTFFKACGIIESEPTTKVRNSVLLQLAENNSYSEEILKKECPKLFPTIDYGVYLKCRNNPLWLCYYDKGIKYGFDAKGNWFKDNSGYQLQLTDYVATPQEVETAFKDLFIKMGFVNGVKVSRDWCITKEVEIVNGKIMYHSHSNAITISGREIFKDGKFATIIETPTDIITIVEKYGKDKIQEYLDNYKNQKL